MLAVGVEDGQHRLAKVVHHSVMLFLLMGAFLLQLALRWRNCSHRHSTVVFVNRLSERKVFEGTGKSLALLNGFGNFLLA